MIPKVAGASAGPTPEADEEEDDEEENPPAKKAKAEVRHDLILYQLQPYSYLARSLRLLPNRPMKIQMRRPRTRILRPLRPLLLKHPQFLNLSALGRKRKRRRSSSLSFCSECLLGLYIHTVFFGLLGSVRFDVCFGYS